MYERENITFEFYFVRAARNIRLMPNPGAKRTSWNVIGLIVPLT
jgi:hypothetical protein